MLISLFVALRLNKINYRSVRDFSIDIPPNKTEWEERLCWWCRMLNKAKSSRSCVCLEPSNRPKAETEGSQGSQVRRRTEMKEKETLTSSSDCPGPLMAPPPRT